MHKRGMLLKFSSLQLKLVVFPCNHSVPQDASSLDQTRSFCELKWCSTSNFFSSLKTRFGSIHPECGKEEPEIFGVVCQQLEQKVVVFLTCLNGYIVRSFRSKVDMVPYDILDSLARISMDLLGVLLIFSLMD